MFELARLRIAFTFDDARRQVIGRPRQSRVSPRLVQSQHQSSGAFTELRTWHVAIVLVLIGMRHLVAVADIPHKTLLVARHLQRVAEETVVCLILRTDVSRHLPLGQRRLRMQDDHTRHSIRSVHQRGGTFQYFYTADTVAIYLHAVLVAPLLSFLAHTFAYHHHAVVAQSADDGFRNAAARSQLTDTWLVGNGVDDVGRGRRPEHLRCYDAHGCSGVLQLRVARHTRHRQFAQLQMAENTSVESSA